MESIAELDASRLTSREVNARLKELALTHDKISIKNPGAKHNIVVGVRGQVEIEVLGNVGYFAAGLIYGPKVRIMGNAGWFAADNLDNSEIIIEGNAGTGVGTNARSGTLVIKGDVNSRLGQVVKGGSIIVGGNAGFFTGMMMMGGAIIICGDVDCGVGESMMGGCIYVAGRVGKPGADAAVCDAPEAEARGIKSLIEKYGLNGKESWKKVYSLKKLLRYEKREY